MLIDDDDSTNFLNKIIIRQANCAKEVISKISGQDALTYLQQEVKEGSVPELILLDINMPIMDGWDFIEKYAELDINKQSRVVMLTSSVNPEDENKAKGIAAISGFRSKPLSNQMLSEIISSLPA